jgi:uncharacterized protein (DUF58 family)
LLALGIASRIAPVCAFGAAMIAAVALGRAVALASVTRLRASGFEMVWNTPKRVMRAVRGATVEIEAELRNRSADDMRGVSLRAVSSSMLETSIEPSIVDLPAESKVFVKVTIRTKRVGRWGLHGMALEVRGTPVGGEGLYEVPLMFANPFGVEVVPRALKAMLDSPKGGRARRGAERGRPLNVPGEGDELRELRDHMPGDPFKRIAWRASAKRGKLVVREMEHEHRDVVWLVVDASVDLWAGPEGEAPLDHVVDQVAAVAARYLSRGDRVGLAITASRLRTWLVPTGGPAQAGKIAAALASAASMVDADRSDLDESDVAARVAEHARPLDPQGLTDVPRGNLDALAARADVLRNRAPFAPRLPFAATPRERTLRHYLAAFGIESAPRAEGEALKTASSLAAVLDRLAREKHKPTVTFVWAPAPSMSASLAAAVRRMRSQRTDIRWILSTPTGAAPNDADEIDSVRDAVEAAISARSRVARIRGEAVLRRMGVKVQGVKGEPKPAPFVASTPELHAEIPPSEPPSLLADTRRELAPEIKENV